LPGQRVTVLPPPPLSSPLERHLVPGRALGPARPNRPQARTQRLGGAAARRAHAFQDERGRRSVAGGCGMGRGRGRAAAVAPAARRAPSSSLTQTPPWPPPGPALRQAMSRPPRRRRRCWGEERGSASADAAGHRDAPPPPAAPLT
jgi:hypothetical protein